MRTTPTEFPQNNDHASVAVTFRLESHEVKKVAALARQDLRTRSSFLRLLILRGLASYEKENAPSAVFHQGE
ncbi:hypothetical protein [uncultured Herbaspirillum sp.]|uniref:hypothetical protein n=1 Tax=uncultured Herbaspirillum sp. TaxID=160236 RepID=UPI00258C16DA|nr:hypothetical protein [uncultured Herbaspirillum sp.]